MYNYTYVYICKYFVYVVEDSVVAFNVKQDMTNSNEIEFDDISNAVNNKNLLSEVANNLDSCGLQKVIHFIGPIFYLKKITTYYNILILFYLTL